MHFSLTDEQKLLQESVEKFIEQEYPFELRQERSGSPLGFSESIWAKYAELGWLGIGISEEDGGYGGGAVETAIVLEGLGAGLAVEPYLSAVVMTGALLGAREPHRAVLAETATGRTRVAFALAERHSRYDLSRVAVSARRDGNGWVLNGAKSVALNADSAHKIVITARTGGEPGDREGITVFLVDAGSPGLDRRGYPTVDGLRAAEVTLSDVRATDGDRIGEVGKGLPLIERAVDAGTVGLCAEAAGIMRHAYQSTVEYLRGREQFGQPLIRFQALQHRVVDMFVEAELSRSMAYMAAVRYEEDSPETRPAIASAKLHTAKSSRKVGEEAIQLHGGMGMTDEMAISHYFKRLSTINATFGDYDHHLEYLVNRVA